MYALYLDGEILELYGIKEDALLTYMILKSNDKNAKIIKLSENILG